MWEALEAPSRIAVVGGTDRDGFGFVFRALDISETTTPAALVRRPPDSTINDVMVAALHLTVQSWNAQHGVPSGRVGIQIPVNVRPGDRLWEVVSNLTSMISVSTTPDDRADLRAAVAAVAEQTYEMRRHDRAYGLYDLLDVTKKAPITVKRAVPKLIHLTGDRFVDTAMLSNLGRIPSTPGPSLGRRSYGFLCRATPLAVFLSASPPAVTASQWWPVTASNNSMLMPQNNSPIC